MKTNGNDKTLESYHFFPYVAWGVTLLFALFVYNITMELKAVTDDLQAQTKHLQAQIEKPVDEVTSYTE